MHRLIEARSPEARARIAAGPLLPPFDAEDLVRHAPDTHWVLLDENSGEIARCSLWWSNTPPLPSQRLGLIGHFAAANAEAGSAILRHACEQLAARGATLAVGPMDGNTWRRYRLITERGAAPPFFLEPDNPDDWPTYFTAQGFTALASYTSALNSDLAQRDPRLPALTARLTSLGIAIRPAAPDRMEDELRRIFAISQISFQKNFLYTPVEESEFLAQYRQVLPFVRPELVLLAEQQGRPIGFLFALPDLLQPRRGEAVDTVIIKTVAVVPERSAAGLGSLLVAHAQDAARELGYRRAIHALMHESNTSRNISGRYATTIRRYTLFARPLAR